MPDSERFIVAKREDLCMCGMAIYDVTDTVDNSVTVAHVGNLKWYDAAHQAARKVWEAERKSNQ